MGDDAEKLKEIEAGISEISKIYYSCSKLDQDKDKTLLSLNKFEVETVKFTDDPILDSVVKRYKSLFLQKANYFFRAEELLDEALNVFTSFDDPISQLWQVKVYLSLGYVHVAQSNYIDADYNLKEAIEIAVNQPSAHALMPEIYSQLSIVNFYIDRFHLCKKYSLQDVEISTKQYRKEKKNTTFAVIFAFSQINYCRINRLIGLVDLEAKEPLEEAIEILKSLKKYDGYLKAILEKAELQYEMNLVENAYLLMKEYQGEYEALGLHSEAIQAAVLIAKIQMKLLDFDNAEKNLTNATDYAAFYSISKDVAFADALFELGNLYFLTNRENRALELYGRSAREGMILGMKSSIVRAYNAARKIDKYKARELLTRDLVYRDSVFVRSRMDSGLNPFTTNRTKIKLCATTLFVDIVGFSSLMKTFDENLTVNIVDELIDRLCIIIFENDGYIDKFLGDGFMAIFEHGLTFDEETAFSALKASVDILRTLKNKNRKLKKAYGVKSDIAVRMGMSTGDIYAMVMGNFIKMEFTYLGNSVNLASKLEGQANILTVLVDEATYTLVKDRVISVKRMRSIPGIGEVEAYEIQRLERRNDREMTE